MSEPRFSGTVKGILEDAEYLRERFKGWGFAFGNVDGIAEAMAVLACDDSPKSTMALDLIRGIVWRLREEGKAEESRQQRSGGAKCAV